MNQANLYKNIEMYVSCDLNYINLTKRNFKYQEKAMRIS